MNSQLLLFGALAALLAALVVSRLRQGQASPTGTGTVQQTHGTVYRLLTDDFMQMDPAGIYARLKRWAETWATLEVPEARLVFRAIPLDLKEPLRAARQAESQAKGEAALRHLRQYAALLARDGEREMLSFEHYLVFPKLNGNAADSMADFLGSGLGVRLERVSDLPVLLPAHYRVTADGLTPEVGNHPLMTTLVSYDMAGTWDWKTLVDVMTVGFPIDISVSISTRHGASAFGALDRAATMLRGLTAQLGNKTALSKSQTDLLVLQESVRSGEALHQVGVAFLLRGKTSAELRDREQQVAGKLAGRVNVRRLNGMHGSVFRSYFTSERNAAPPKRLLHNMSSSGLALACGPIGLHRRGDTNGVYWGPSRQEPFCWDGFGENLNRPAHGVILGTTGSGKTLSMLSIAMREMNLRGTQVLVMDPLGNVRRLVDAVGPERSSHNVLSLTSLRLNPVECMYADLAEQAQHLAVVTRLLLGRALTEDEEIAISTASRIIYEGVTPDTPAVNQPRIEDMARVLKSLVGYEWLAETGDSLGSRLEVKYVQGPLAATFNTPTLTDWRLQKDLVAFNFRGIPEGEGMRRLLYYLVLSTIHREAYRQARQRRRIVLIDEFRVMSAEPDLARQVSLMFKTFRTLGVGVWAMEQDLTTFTGMDRAGLGASVDVQAGLQILSNAAFVFALAHKAAGAKEMPKYFPQLTDEYVRYLSSMNPDINPNDRGRGLMILSDAVYPVRIALTAHELQVLGGS